MAGGQQSRPRASGWDQFRARVAQAEADARRAAQQATQTLAAARQRVERAVVDPRVLAAVAPGAAIAQIIRNPEVKRQATAVVRNGQSAVQAMGRGVVQTLVENPLLITNGVAAVPTVVATNPKMRNQALAGGRGAQDAFTFGLGDRVYAGGSALYDAASGKDLGQAYRDRMEIERERDRYDAEHYPVARTVGQVTGTAGQIALLSPVQAIAGGARIAQAAPLVGREIMALGAAGATAGVADQAVSDLMAWELGSLGDYAGSALGGVAGVTTAKTGNAALAGSVSGATASLLQDAFNGRPISADDARAAALIGSSFGALGGRVGRKESNELNGLQKQRLGEWVSRQRTFVRGDETLPHDPTAYKLPSQRNTYPDQRTRRGILVESKFGRGARLSRNQTEAAETLSNYRVDATLPQDIGFAVGLPVGLLSADLWLHGRE